jgi:hypothetical protein
VLGVASLAGISVMVLMIPTNIIIGKITQKLQEKQMMQKDARIKETNEVFTFVRAFKMI